MNVRQIVYLLLFAAALLIFKAMFLDDYLAERAAREANATQPAPVPPAQTVSEQPPAPPAAPVAQEEEKPKTFSKPVPVLKQSGIYTGEQNLTVKKKVKPSYSEMPLEKVGNTIADKLEDKL